MEISENNKVLLTRSRIDISGCVTPNIVPVLRDIISLHKLGISCRNEENKLVREI